MGKLRWLLEEADWRPTQEIQVEAGKLFTGVLQTKIVEDAFQRERAGESSKSFNRTIAPARVWSIPIDENVVENKHRFDIVPCDATHVQRGSCTGTRGCMLVIRHF